MWRLRCLRMHQAVIRKLPTSPYARAAMSVTTMEAPQLKAQVRYKEGADKLYITLTIMGKQRNMERPADEPLERPLARMRANLAPPKASDKRQKKQRQAPPAPAPAAASGAPWPEDLLVALYEDAEGRRPLVESTPNRDAWPRARLLVVGPQRFEVEVNPPTVESLKLPAWLMPGHPVQPAVALAFADQAQGALQGVRAGGAGAQGGASSAAPAALLWREEACQWRWQRRRRRSSSGGAAAAEAAAAAAGAAAAGAGGWEDLGCSDRCYTPAEGDVDCTLQVQCTPGRSVPGAASSAAGAVLGEVVSAEGGPVRLAPALPAARVRALAGGAPTPRGALRVISYNILAEQYTGNEYAQKVLFGYCPTELLASEYRRQLVLQELLAYQGDVVCLQEVDEKVFDEYLVPHLRRAGYEGTYATKAGVKEGSATFWRTARFRCPQRRAVNLRECFRLPLSERHAQFAPMLDASPALAEALQKVTTIGQVTLLVPQPPPPPSSASNGGGAVHDAGSNGAAAPSAGTATPSTAADGAAVEPPLCVINTHLFFHPYAPHIRSLHVAALQEEAAAMLAEWAVSEPALAGLSPPALLFCGDLNSDLNDGVPGAVELLQTGRLSASHWDWRMGAAFSWGKGEEEYGDGGPSAAAADAASAAAEAAEAAAAAAAEPAVMGVDVVAPFALRSADDLLTPWTNYTSGYRGLLDYVWYQADRMAVTRQLPMPAEQLLSSFIPSASFPSDHLAVVYDFAFRQPAPQHAPPQQQQQRQPAASPSADVDADALGRHAPGAFLLLPALSDHLHEAAAALGRSEVVALPTDTLYGLAASAADAVAVARLRALKRRRAGQPLAVAVGDVGDVGSLCVTEGLPPGLLEALLPGPATVVLPRRGNAPLAAEALPPGQATLAVRVPSGEFVRALARRAGPLALTSANPSGEGSTLEVTRFRELWPYCGAVFDGGRIPVADDAGSTIVDLCGSVATTNAGGADGDGDRPQRTFRVLRRGVAAANVVALLVGHFGLQEEED